MDFGALPPEINSARMYSGAGSAPLLGAASAWGALAEELHSAAELYRALITQVVDASWWGPSAMAMLAAVGPYVSWMSATASHAEQVAGYARAVVGAYEIAYAATVPPAEVAANRSLLSLLVATNLLGQNSSAIAAAEAQYAEMWAQDAAVMYGYAGASRVASMVTPFQTPPATTATSGEGRQQTAVAQAVGSAAQQRSATELVAAIREVLERISSSPSQSATWEELRAQLPQIVKNLTTTEQVVQRLASTPANLLGISKAFAPSPPAAAPAATITPALPATVGAARSAGVPAAGFGRAATVGKLSVPPGWVSVAPAISPEVSAPQAVPSSNAVHNQPGGLLRGMPMSAGAARRSDGYVNRYGFRYNVLTHHPAGG
ncbi:PPE family protein [Mycolicibacter kumamotonensis]|uniref:PPE family protein PPE51 n=1 Tax=Mycolicibacter kumamotonensis TaxID=354243 RepID=A0A1B8SHK6_9MYCO|nr:PPE family protein [Mycolicibacter kumamotonensis]OBY32231.1 PPE family protein PPE51 [Mycolicibacter kumamotonensis]